MSLFETIVNLISLSLGLLGRQIQQFKDVTLDSGNLVAALLCKGEEMLKQKLRFV